MADWKTAINAARPSIFRNPKSVFVCQLCFPHRQVEEVWLTLPGMPSCRTYTNPVGAAPLHMGDPFAWRLADRYYLTGTTDPDEGFRCYHSPNLTDWSEGGWLWRREAASWVDGRMWAPEVCAYRGRFYLTYSSTLRGVTPMRMLMGLAVSDQPEGPYLDLRTPWFDPGYSTIDGHLFIDDDFTPWLYFSRNGSRDGYDYGTIYGCALAKTCCRRSARR